MPATQSSSLELDIPQSPEIIDPELFKEFLRVYNSMRIIVQALDEILVGDPLSADAIDLTTAIDLVNEIRAVLIAARIAT